MLLFNIILNHTRVGEGIKDKIDDLKYTTRVGEVVQDVHKGVNNGLYVTERIGQTLGNGLDSG